jgi:hypothetical protein
VAAVKPPAHLQDVAQKLHHLGNGDEGLEGAQLDAKRCSKVVAVPASTRGCVTEACRDRRKGSTRAMFLSYKMLCAVLPSRPDIGYGQRCRQQLKASADEVDQG